LPPSGEGTPLTSFSGGFRVEPLLPGRYLVAAYENPTGAVAVFDRAGLEQLKPHAVTVTVTAGEKARVQVPSPPGRLRARRGSATSAQATSRQLP
jgi:hypothetical protein